MRKSKNRYFYHIWFPCGRPWGNHTKCCIDGTMLTNCLAAYAHLTITVSEIQRDIGRIWSIFSYPLHSTPPLRGFPLEHRHPVWYWKNRMAWLPDGEKISKISLFVLAQLTNVTDGRTDTGWRHIPRLCIASRGKNATDTLISVTYFLIFLWMFTSVISGLSNQSTVSFYLNPKVSGVFEKFVLLYIYLYLINSCECADNYGAQRYILFG